ncbi:MAG TPA: FBP domain-containing protein [Candidatus Saccharimonadales bacterium]|nr:FBP domain-containing protein [Candidatus Saccharimonadales bacterium]
MNAITREQFSELISGVRPRLRRELRFVPEEITDWEYRDFLAVTNKQGSEGVLIVPFLGDKVVPFSLQPRKPGASGRVEAIICDICATWQRGTHSAVITFTIDKSRSVSFLCCGDLECSLHVRGKTADATLSRTQLREQITPEARIARLHGRLTSILSIYE